MSEIAETAASCGGVNNEVGGGFQAFPSPSEFCHKATITANSTKYEFSGGDFRSSTCSHLVVNDAKWLNEYQMMVEGDNNNKDNHKMILEDRYRLRGFSGDYEGICLYEETDGPAKLAVIDEGNRTAALCDFPSGASSTDNEIDLEGDDCVSYSLSPEVLNNVDLFDPSINRGFEGVACDPQEQKLYIAQEKDPMAIWQLDLVTGSFEVLIPVSSLEPWTDLLEDLAGIAFDPTKRTLYVLSEDSKLVVESTLEGDILGLPLDVSQANQPEGIYFAPSKGELWIASEPNELLVFKADEETCSGAHYSMGSFSVLSTFLLLCVGLGRQR